VTNDPTKKKPKNPATDDEVCVCEWYYAYPFSEEPEPEHREQRVLETRSWHDTSKVTCRIRDRYERRSA